MLKKISSLLLGLLLLINFSLINASAQELSYYGESKTDLSYKVIKERFNIEPDKQWTIRLSNEIGNDSLIEENIYVLNEDNKEIGVKLGLLEDNKSIIITPLSDYEYGKSYTLYIENLKDINGNNLNENIQMKFTIKDEYEELNEKYNVAVNKYWTIEFSKPVDFNSVNEENIFVLDENGNAIEIEYSFDKTKRYIKVIPVKNYEYGKSYVLFVKYLKDTEGKKLKDNVKMKFNIVEN